MPDDLTPHAVPGAGLHRHAQQRLAQSHLPQGSESMSFMVHDKRGNVWPPQFRSELCNPDSPRSMLSPKAKSLALALDAANAARATGKGWGKGEIAHLVKPILPKTTA